MSDIKQISLNGSVYDLRDADWIGRKTNCITEIPQDIKLDLNSGTLTLKSGSKLTYPDGTQITTSADETIATHSSNGEYLCVKNRNGGCASFLKSLCYSGTTAPTGFSGNALWFDTTNNIIKNSYDSGATWSNDWSFPVGMVTSASSAYTSIDQVFNGFGYIGSTVFVLPGVKGLIPTGKNTDGTLKNATLTTSSVLKLDVPVATSRDILRLTDTILQRGDVYYIKDVNYNCTTPNYTRGNIRTVVNIGTVSYTGGKITSLSIKNIFNALDYNDSNYIANCAMPSGNYLDLTLGASWSAYTAPADGYICLRKAGNSDEYIKIINTTSQIGSMGISRTGGFDIPVTVPVSKGDTFQIAYSASGATNYFRFVYANGSK